MIRAVKKNFCARNDHQTYYEWYSYLKEIKFASFIQNFDNLIQKKVSDHKSNEELLSLREDVQSKITGFWIGHSEF